MERFGKFQLLERIGEGGMAEIYLASPSDAMLSKLVAVKRILPKYANEPAFNEMFRREGEIALRLRHPAIIMVHELGTVNHRSYMSMEFFPGKTLAVLARSQDLALDVPEKLFIIKSIAEALQYIHDFSDYGDVTEIIHRDISPQNIMVGFDGVAKLIDFGIAKIIDKEEGTNDRGLKGKMAYMSPEQIRGDQLTKQTDIFSLGIVLWEFLAGRKLFTGSSAEEVARKIEACEVPLLSAYAPRIPLEVELICRKALARNTADRYPSAGDLVADISDCLRSFKRDGYQKQIAKTMQKYFAEDMTRLQEQLKRYESEKPQASANPSTRTIDILSPPTAAQKPPSLSLASPTTPPRTATSIPTPVPQLSLQPTKKTGSSVPTPPSIRPPRADSSQRFTSPSEPASHRRRLALMLGVGLALGGILATILLLQMESSPTDTLSAEMPQSYDERSQESENDNSKNRQEIGLRPERASDPSYDGLRQHEVSPDESPSHAKTPAVPFPGPQPELQKSALRRPPSVSSHKEPRGPKELPRQNMETVATPVSSARPASRQAVKARTPQLPTVLPPLVKDKIAGSKQEDVKKPKTDTWADSSKSSPVRAERRLPPKTTSEPKVATKPVETRPKDTKSNERKPAAPAAPGLFAHVTIFADPDAEIWIDGKSAGIEIVNDLRVPADKKITIKVVQKSGQVSKVQKIQLKPYSRSVLDMATQENN